MTNSVIRHRKGESEETLLDKGSNSMRRPPSYRFIRIIFYILATSISLFVIFLMLNNAWPFKKSGHGISSLDKMSATLGLQKRLDAVIIDAGSTGSRVLAFTFYKSLADNSLKLHEDELWHEIKPGLSSYANNPKEGAQSLISLLDLAKERIPSKQWASTPIILRATAGLRLLDEEKANALLNEVRIVINQSGFLTSETSVEIMDGKDEGIFSWFTSNYLLDTVGNEAEKTIVALDLGGGSTQVTFVPKLASGSIDKLELAPISILGKNLDIFTHSYLGLGLMAARAAILTAETNDQHVTNSSCINPIIDIEWSYGDKIFRVRGPSNPTYKKIEAANGRIGQTLPIANYKDCLLQCRKYIAEKIGKIPAELGSREIIAFSYYFDKAAERGLIDPYKGGIVTVLNMLQEAKRACESPNSDQPFACLDMTFIGTLLSRGYGIKADTPVKLFKRIDGHELSWALGLAFHTVTNL